MSDPLDHDRHHRTHTPALSAPYMEFDLLAEFHRLKSESAWSKGQNARTLIKYDDLRVVLMALPAKAQIPEHQTDGRLSIQVLSGHIQIRAAGRTFNLHSGGLLTFDHGIRHDVMALEESALLLTIAWPRKA